MAKTIAIVVGGGPAPGINCVISSVVIEAHLRGHKVFGAQHGFKGLVQSGVAALRILDIHELSRIHNTGGSILGTSRENPTGDPKKLSTVLAALRELGIDSLVTIGGDDTAFASRKVAEAAQADGFNLQVLHVPKTIDNDLPLPNGIVTFGYETARAAGVEVVNTLMEDAKTTGRWYFVVAMGRKAGHLALGIGQAAGATLTLIGEEFGPGPLELGKIADVLEGSILKRLAEGRSHGVAVLAEGLAEMLDENSLQNRDDLERDEFGHIRFAEVDLGKLLKTEVRKRLKAHGISMTIVEKNVGYELRCKDPVPFDISYTRVLGNGAVALLDEGVTECMVSVQDGSVVPIKYEDLLDPDTGKTKVRLVDADSDSFKVAQRYMIRLRPDDLRDQGLLDAIVDLGSYTSDEVRTRWG